MSDDGNDLPWVDYHPDQRDLAKTCTHLRIGFPPESSSDEALSMSIAFREFARFLRLLQVQIYLPSVKSIGESAFCQCSALVQVEFVPALKNTAEQDDDDDDNHSGSKSQSKLSFIGHGAFGECWNLHRVIGLNHASESLEEIGSSVFSNCISLEGVDFLPYLQRLKSLRHSAWYSAESITSIDLSQAIHVTHLHGGTFMFCYALETVYLPPLLRTIGSKEFLFCRKLRAIHLPPSLQSIGESCFQRCGQLRRITLPSSRMPFMRKRDPLLGCKSLSALDLPMPVPREHWPLVLKKFCRKYIYRNIKIHKKCCTSIVFSFLCRHIPQYFVEKGVVKKIGPSLSSS